MSDEPDNLAAEVAALRRNLNEVRSNLASALIQIMRLGNAVQRLGSAVASSKMEPRLQLIKETDDMVDEVFNEAETLAYEVAGLKRDE